MAKRHADDLVFYATIGVILGGRIGYVLFYAPGLLLDPLQVFKLWDGGMSFHGGVIGTRLRSEERRVGQECVRTWRSRWSPSHETNHTISEDTTYYTQHVT